MFHESSIESYFTFYSLIAHINLPHPFIPVIYMSTFITVRISLRDNGLNNRTKLLRGSRYLSGCE